MSPFEIKNRLIEMAQADAYNSTATFLNAGRGNPNWIATEPREAFFLLGKFGLEECRRTADNTVGIAGIPPAGHSRAIAANFSTTIKMKTERPHQSHFSNI